MKKLFYAISIVVVLALLVAAVGRWYVRTAESASPSATIVGLQGKVEIWRDSLGVPHVWAATDADAMRAMGYVHAQDRLWQMDLLRRVADGRLAEVLGPEALEADRFLRTLGMGRAARAEERLLEAEPRALLQAYADGVNAWMRHHPGALPPEFLVLRFEPEPWTVRNSLSIGKAMSWDLADWNIGLDLQRAIQRVGAERGRELVPRYPENGIRILPDGDPVRESRAPLPAPAGPRVAVRASILPRVPALAAELLGAASASHGSNSWVVDGTRTRSGKPILANDPHLELRAPSLWYLAALHGSSIHVAGVTIPGLPLVLLGHTSRIAWGFTNAMADDVDFFVERVDPADSTRYLTPTGWVPFRVRSETIRVKGADPVIIRVRETRHGPVMSDVDARARGSVLAMQWTALSPSTSHAGLIGMNRARSRDEFLRALRLFNDPHQNVVFATAAGEIGYWMVGRIPVRRSGDGLLPRPGWTGEGDWVGYLDFDQHPHTLDPEEAFLVTANNAQAGKGYAHHIGSYYAEPHRASRIREMLVDARRLTAEDVARQQMDVRDALARGYLPLAVRAAEAAGKTGAARALREWDARATVDSHAAALFYTWYERLRRRVGDDEYSGKDVFFPRYTLNRILDAGGGAWVDDVTTAGREDLAGVSAAAMAEAVDEVGDRVWGDLHTTHIRHALGSANILDRTLELNVAAFPSPGSYATVNVAAYGKTPPFVNTNGASMRHVVDMADPDGAGGFVIPTGQSGLPFSPHYRDQTAYWREGRLWKIPLDRSRSNRVAVRRMILEP